jgi:hypothetical protein
MTRASFICGFAVTLATALPAAASDYVGFVESDVRSWFETAMVLNAVKAANMANAGLSENDILALDAEWRSASGSESALIDGILGNGVSEYLRTQMAATGGRVTEVILMDAQGLNVAITGKTSDYWQGDEEKHQMTYDVGPDAVHVSEIELDESTQTYQLQVSFSVVDPATQELLGAVTIGLNAELF